MNKRLVATLFSALIIITGSVIAIRFAQGYRPTTSGTLRPTGLLAANSFPNGASVYINGNLTTATDTTINLEPGEYDVEIQKDGFSPWKKRVRIEKELVVQTNAVLFPSAPSLAPLTLNGADNVTPSPDGQSLLFTTASASASRNNGLYVMNLTDSLLALQKGPQLIARSSSTNLEGAKLLWSPDSTEAMVLLPGKTFLIEANRTADLDAIQDMTIRRRQILEDWYQQLAKKQSTALELFPQEIQAIATMSATAISISPDQDRLLYTATASAQLPEELLNSPVASNTQKQERTLVPGVTYVYDRHEDRNFRIEVATNILGTPMPSASTRPTRTPTPRPRMLNALQASPSPEPSVLSDSALIDAIEDFTSPVYRTHPQWFPDSKHVILTSASGVDIISYDGTNRTTVYAGPFERDFVYPWPNGSKLVILTSFNQPSAGLVNLYAVGLK